MRYNALLRRVVNAVMIELKKKKILKKRSKLLSTTY